MIRGRRVLAVVPARGGSKGVPLKNLRPVLGIPIVARVGHLLQQIPEIDRKVVSTDHDRILEVARESGLSVEFRRPEELSGDLISDLDVLTHALEEMERKDGVTYDVVALFPPTSPLRTVEHVRDTLMKLVDGGYDSVLTVSESDTKYHPLKAVEYEDGRLRFHDQRGSEIIARQQLTPLYHRNGACYAYTRECILDQQRLVGANASAIVTEFLVSIDTVEDFETVERLMRERTDDGPADHA